MTREELELKAKEYALSKWEGQVLYGRLVQKGFIEGYNEGRTKWHDLKKNPNDLPRVSGKYLVYTGDYFIMDFDTEANDFGYWVGSVSSGLGLIDTEFQTLTELNEDIVIAWCEVQKFEGV